MALKVRMLMRRLLAAAVIAVAVLGLIYADHPAQSGLRNATVLIIRHAEKPTEGSVLNARGEERARAYADYFNPLKLDGQTLIPERLIAAGDSPESSRSRLTLTPLAERLNLSIEQPYINGEVHELVKLLRKSNQAPTVLIAWHHGHINKLLKAFGGDATALMGQRKWPDDVFDWLIVLRFDDEGRLIPSRSLKVQEHLLPGDTAQSPGS
ncbi:MULTISPECIES: flagellar basal body-associated protein FliL [unclassified Pseudomonas]|uniref:flagellar basal body-associated protein FliL n=1 Tax=unclassified Pseudomonas TaxID=196821 RepID=UPI000A1D8191|nr:MULTISPECIES: flagellar basal body-associated protein FliL [unclassified Pseudomonas]AWA42524.1 flagellar basal body-associated protein FliL [Pseudomonas fluorescens]